MDSVSSVSVSALEIRGATCRYPVLVGADLLDDTGKYARQHIDANARGCAVISDSNVAPLHAKRVLRSLRSNGFLPALITVPAGEKSKTLSRAGAICERMVAAELDRHSFVVGVGGGVVGDISGFVAAIYQRGIPHIQIPTTLLAMADSSIGGKTGVDTRRAKNLIGAFHHPSLVIDDVEVLKTLGPRQFNQGFAEVIKHAVIADAQMFEQLQCWTATDARALQSLILRNISIKSAIVAKDERDRTGERALLNFGHTVGHAIEQAGGYRRFLHGEALSLGMIAACAISIARAGLPPQQRDAIVSLLRRFNLPTRLPKNFPRRKIFGALKYDKKFEGGKIRFVVTPKIGVARLTSEVTPADIQKAIDEL